jgi:hypothetical protein
MVERKQMKISVRHIAAPPNNSIELTSPDRRTPCKKKSKGCAAFALQPVLGGYAAQLP